MSREIQRRSKLSGLASSDLIQESVTTMAGLMAIPVLDSMDGTLVYVTSEQRIYAYHAYATDTADGVTVVTPPSAKYAGRWILVSSSVSASAPATTADRWVDPTHADALEAIVVHNEWEIRRGSLVVDSSLVVDEGGAVYVTTGSDPSKRPDFHQSNNVPADVWRSVPPKTHLVVHTTTTNPLNVEGHLNVHGDLICINFFNV